MKLSGAFSAWNRRVLAVVGSAAVVFAASVVAAGADYRTVAEPVAIGLDQEQPDGMTFNDADRLFVYFQIAPEQAKDFELVIAKMKEALASSTKPERQAQAKGLRVIKLNDMQGGNWMYVFVLDPVVKGITYDPFKILGEALPADDVRQLFESVQPGLKGISRAAYTEIAGGGMN
jgi:hypothetical protein